MFHYSIIPSISHPVQSISPVYVEITVSMKLASGFDIMGHGEGTVT